MRRKINMKLIMESFPGHVRLLCRNGDGERERESLPFLFPLPIFCRLLLSIVCDRIVQRNKLLDKTISVQITQ